MFAKRSLSALTLCALLGAPAAALADFGPLGPDAGPLGKAGACVASAEGPGAAYWNPAGAARGPSGFDFLFSFGMLQRPDFSAAAFGASSRYFLGMSFVPEGGEAGKPGIFGFSLAFETPYPRFEYNGAADVLLDGGGSAVLSMKSSSDYAELAAAAAFAPLSGVETPLGGLSLSAGLGFGLGFSSSAASGGLYSGGALIEEAGYAGTRTAIPVSLGVIASIKGGGIEVSLGVKYRGILSAGAGDALSFPVFGYAVDSAGAFMNPPQEGVLGLSATFFERISYSAELSYLFFDAAGEFPNLVPHNYPTFKFGFEYRAVGSAEEGGALFLRFGFSQSVMSTDAVSSVFTSESTGFYLGAGFRAGPVRADFFFTHQIPGAGDVDEASTFAGISVGIGRIG